MFFRSTYLTNRFFAVLIVLAILFIIGYAVPAVAMLAKVAFFGWVVLIVMDLVSLFKIKNGIEAKRIHDAKLSNGDDNDITVNIKSNYEYNLNAEIVDEIPHQFQRRDISWKIDLPKEETKNLVYKLRPLKRGEYSFGAINIYVSTLVGLIQRRYTFPSDTLVPVYPSIIQMKKYEFSAFTNNLTELGLKRIRRIGQTTEFDQIKEYVRGDDPRNINWKASAKSTGLMVNHYEDEKSQPIYCIIDKGRLLRSPFDGLTLLDYSVNSTLVMTNVALRKQDKAGIITFSNKMSSVVKADRKSGQLNRILETLYNQKTFYKESNFEILAGFVQRRITNRSLLLLYTNFESMSSYRRQLPYLRMLSKKHLVVVIFFENTELDDIIQSDPESNEALYTQVVAEKFALEKQLIVSDLKKNGIHSILTAPENLNVNTINKYLEFKARGMV